MQVETLDVMQIHNLTKPVLSRDEVWQTLEEACKAGKIRFLGRVVTVKMLPWRRCGTIASGLCKCHSMLSIAV